MTSRDNKTGGPAAPPGEGDLLTSEDIFGDMLDDAGRDRSAGALPAPRAAGARKSPIKVKVGGPGPTPKTTPCRPPATAVRCPTTRQAARCLPSLERWAKARFGDVAPVRATARRPVLPPRPRAPRAEWTPWWRLLNLQKPRPSRTPTAPPPRAVRENEPPPRRGPDDDQVPGRDAAGDAVPEGGGIDLAGLATGMTTAAGGEAAARARPGPAADATGRIACRRGAWAAWPRSSAQAQGRGGFERSWR